MRPPGEPAGEPIALDWPPERGRVFFGAMMLLPWLLGPLAATVAVAVLDVDAKIGSDTWALLAGVGLLLSSALLATILMLVGAASWLRDSAAPDRVEGILVLRATARPRGGDGSSEQNSYYLAVDDGTRPVPVYRSSAWLNGRLHTGERALLVVGPHRRRVLKVIR